MLEYCQRDMRVLAGGEIEFIGQALWQYCPHACGGCPHPNHTEWTVPDHEEWCACSGRGSCMPPYSGSCVCDEGWIGPQCDRCISCRICGACAADEDVSPVLFLLALSYSSVEGCAPF